MRNLFQVGVGSGGMVVLDLLIRDERIHAITLVDPDVYQPHNAVRHYFPQCDSGQKKVELAARWIAERRPEISITKIVDEIASPTARAQIEEAIQQAAIGICAVDSEPAKFQFDALMRQFQKPWTMGEVLSGGIGGWVHLFKPGEACYGCVASHLQRTIQTDRTPVPDYANPQAAIEAARIPASKAAISVIASLHANITLDMLDGRDAGFSSLLLPLARVEGVFPEAYKPFRFRIARSPECLICGSSSDKLPPGEDLDVALDQALARLGHE